MPGRPAVTLTSQRQVMPWGTVALTAGNVVVFIVAGAAPDYGIADSPGEGEVPSIGRLLVDVVRHPRALLLLVTVGFLVPAAIVVERLVGPVGLVATYVVGGFGAGFVEVLASSSEELAVGGAFGGTTAVLAMWGACRWHTGRAVLSTVAVAVTWGWLHSVIGPDGLWWLGAAVATGVGWYACRDGGVVRRAREARRR